MLGQFPARGYSVNGVVLDTHSVIWYVCEPDKLGKAGADVMFGVILLVCLTWLIPLRGRAPA